MCVLAQSYDAETVLANIEQCIHDYESALCDGNLHAANIHAEDGLAEIVIYWQCREEGEEEPYCGIAGYAAADRYVSDAADTFQRIYAEDLQP